MLRRSSPPSDLHARVPGAQPAPPVDQLKKALEDVVVTLNRLARVIEEKQPPA
jgi:hypothetical protein